MIAPIRPCSEEEPQSLDMRDARRAAAAMLTRANPSDIAVPPVPAWQAWLLVGWMAITALAFLSIMAGGLKEKP